MRPFFGSQDYPEQYILGEGQCGTVYWWLPRFHGLLRYGDLIEGLRQGGVLSNRGRMSIWCNFIFGAWGLKWRSISRLLDLHIHSWLALVEHVVGSVRAFTDWSLFTVTTSLMTCVLHDIIVAVTKIMAMWTVTSDREERDQPLPSTKPHTQLAYD